MNIHPTAVVEVGAQVGEGTTIGPLCVIGPQVTIGRNNRIQSNVVIDGVTTLGDDNEVFSFACLGKRTQDLKYVGGAPRLRIGSNNSIREYVTINTATDDGDETVVGSGCLLQSYVHIAHDCIIGNCVVISGGSMLSGHVQIGDHAIISGMTGVIQFVRIGEFSFVGGFTKLTGDVVPYCIVDGIPATTVTINKVGLDRNGFSKATIRAIYRAQKLIFKSGKTLAEAKVELAEVDDEHVQVMLKFLHGAERGLA